MPFLNHKEIQLYYEQHGSGPPLMLIAGLASDSQSWLPVVEGLAKQFAVILLDNRGVGRSTQECEISVSLMADDCAALIRHLGYQRVAVTGHSMGGMIAMELSRQYPDLVDRLVLVATAAKNRVRNNLLFQDWADWYEAGTNRAAWFRTVLYWIFTKRFFENQPLLDASLNYLLKYPWPQSPQAFRQQVQAIAGFDATPWLGQVMVPTCVLAGEQDLLMPPGDSEYLAQQLPNAVLEVVKGAAHSIHTEQPEAFMQCLLEFLAGGCHG
ncbi:Pimeloyl-ACP methyl ester carboxylesterase [Trichlorobacter thiogenes]|uniref:Pimeloyl-ACP methyl ester carboxylesterase n=1 Tax=Trichlorobacter thiogenes TaxID=115783 RepID=A0A1T4NKX1_9BACT|nr:alpha/beta hydrolase [Trichlorobacter thiogenes]SJZ79726.1 Pimeloyl-ACP methyl ester carboxylesterase [Trichlorobacter thiogenes]